MHSKPDYTQSNPGAENYIEHKPALGTMASQNTGSFEPAVTSGIAGQYWNGLKQWITLTAALLGLGNVDNTSDVNKPVSTAQASANSTVASNAANATATVQTSLNTHTSNTSNPHLTTKAQVGLGSSDNTSDANKPVSTATQTALNLKANTSSLATVATTGTYSDLIGKPTIPAAQIQSDWTQASSASVDYIKNRQITKKWSGTTSSGSCVLYLTQNGLVGGTAYYSAIESVQIFFVGNDTNLGKTYALSGVTLTIAATQQSFNGITVVGIPVLGSISLAAVPNGTQMYAVVTGTIT